MRHLHKAQPFLLTDVQLTYNVVLISAVQQSDSVLHIYIYISESVSHSVVSLCDFMDSSMPGSSVHGILQARILRRVAIPFSRGIFQTQGLNPGSPALADGYFTI